LDGLALKLLRRGSSGTGEGPRRRDAVNECRGCAGSRCGAKWWCAGSLSFEKRDAVRRRLGPTPRSLPVCRGAWDLLDGSHG
jgi:hypothetical protein